MPGRKEPLWYTPIIVIEHVSYTITIGALLESGYYVKQVSSNYTLYPTYLCET